MQMLVLSEKVPRGMEEVNLNKILRYAMSFESEFDKIHIITSYNYSKKFDFSQKLNFHQVKWKETKSSLPGIFFHFLYLAGVFYCGLKILKKHRDITVVTNSWGHYMLGLLAVALSKIINRKSIVRVTGSLEVGTITIEKRYGWSFNRILLRMERVALKYSDLVISVSEYIFENYPMIREKTFIIPDLFPVIEEFSGDTLCLDKESSETGNIKILYIGRLEPEKGVDILLESLKSIEHRCTIVGDGSLREELEEHSIRLGVKERITFAGYLKQNEVHKLICISDFLILPSYSEFTPNVIIEAMAIGTPVVASNVGGIKYLVQDGENGFTFKRGSVQELTTVLTRAIDSPTLREDVSKRAKAYVHENFNSEKIKKQTHQAVAKLL